MAERITATTKSARVFSPATASSGTVDKAIASDLYDDETGHEKQCGELLFMALSEFYALISSSEDKGPDRHH